MTTEGKLPPAGLLSIEGVGAWQAVAVEPARSDFAALLSRYAREQRWYRSKSLPVRSAQIEDIYLFGPGFANDHCVLVLTVESADERRESYLIPLYFALADAEEIPSETPAAIVTEVLIQLPYVSQPARGAFLDATGSSVFARALLSLLSAELILQGESGTLTGELFEPLARPPVTALEPRCVQLEQSNSTILYGSLWLLKLLRKVEFGPNVELSVQRFLWAAEPKPNVPRPLGKVELQSAAGTRTLALLSEYVENQGTAWSFTLESLFSFFERVLCTDAALLSVPLPDSHPAANETPVPDALLRLTGGYFSLVKILAERTVGLHRALGRATSDAEFGQEPFSLPYQRALYEAAHAGLVRGFEKLRTEQPVLCAEAADLAAQVLGMEGAIDERLRRIHELELGVTRIRCHGDYHLGQVLFTGADFVIIDFEGEPGRSLSERRSKQSPLRDVAGMLRSFAYAAESSLRSPRVRAEDRARLSPFAEAFRAWTAVSFTQTYLAGITGEPFCPKTAADSQALLSFYELEKVLYEVDYELDNRPDWAVVPLVGLARIASS